jgi:hypothetical protein
MGLSFCKQQNEPLQNEMTFRSAKVFVLPTMKARLNDAQP